eukprot:7212482-Pyramimonas_sp.AAC.1
MQSRSRSGHAQTMVARYRLSVRHECEIGVVIPQVQLGYITSTCSPAHLKSPVFQATSEEIAVRGLIWTGAF